MGYSSGDDEEEYGGEVGDLLCIGQRTTFNLNISKTPYPITIRGEEVEIVDSYRFIGVHISNRLDWMDVSDVLYRKAQS